MFLTKYQHAVQMHQGQSIVCWFRYAEEAPDDEVDAPQLVPLTSSAAAERPGSSAGQKTAAASEGTPLLADRIGQSCALDLCSRPLSRHI